MRLMPHSPDFRPFLSSVLVAVVGGMRLAGLVIVSVKVFQQHYLRSGSGVGMHDALLERMQSGKQIASVRSGANCASHGIPRLTPVSTIKLLLFDWCGARSEV